MQVTAQQSASEEFTKSLNMSLSKTREAMISTSKELSAQCQDVLSDSLKLVRSLKEVCDMCIFILFEFIRILPADYLFRI